MQRILAFLKAHKYFTIIASIVIVYLLFSMLAVNPISKRVIPWAANKYFNSQASIGSLEYDPFELSLDIQDFKLNNRAAQTLTHFDRLFVDYELSGIFDWAWTFKSIQLSKPTVSLAYAEGGAFNWDDLISAMQSEQKNSKESDLPRVVIDKIAIEDGHFGYENADQTTPVKSTVAPLNFALEHFSTLPNKNGDYQITAKLPEQEGEISWGGHVTVNPLSTQGKIALNHIDIPKVLALVKDLSLPVTSKTGLADLQFDYDFKLTPAPKIVESEPSEAEMPPQTPASKHLMLSNVALQLHDVNTAFISNRQQADNSLARGALATKLIDVQVPNIAIDITDTTALAFEGLSAQFSDSQLSLNNREQNIPLLSLPNIAVDSLAFNLIDNKLSIASIALDKGEVNAAVDQSGLLDWQQAFAQLGQDKAPTISAETQTIKTENIANNTEATIEAVVDTAAPAVEPEIEAPGTDQLEQTVTLDNDSTSSEVVAVTDMTAKPFSLQINVIEFNHWRANWQDSTFKKALSADVDDINIAFKLNMAEEALSITDLYSEVGKLQAHSGDGKQAIATLNAIKLDKADIDIHGKKAALGAIVASGFRSQIIHDKTGAINWQSVLEKPHSQGKQNGTTRSAAQDADATQWKFLLNSLALKEANIHIEEQSPAKPLVLDITQGNIKLSNISQNLKTAIPMHLGFDIKQGGKVAFDGKVQPKPLNADLNVKLDQISLKPLASYINELALLELNDGATSVAGKLALKQGKTLSGSFKGGFSIDKLAVTEDEGSHDNFLSWQQMATDDLTINIAPNSVSIGELTFSKPITKFIIYEDKTLNLTRILRKEQANEVQQLDEVNAAETTVSNKEPFPIRIERTVFKDAELDFADLSLRPQFGTHINTLSGVIAGISSEETASAKVALKGKVDTYGSAEIKGELKPFKATDFTNMQLIFKNLEMSKLTPYSGKFAGRRIDSGKMSVDLDYKINDHKLAGENNFVINKLKLGEKIDSEDATDLPLDLAIAILEDNNGVIDLDLPVAGDLDNPEFKISGIVWKAFTNIMTKIVTAPFKLLGSMLGGGGDDLEAIVFEAGDATLQPPEQEKLKAVSDALLKRNKLQLTVTPSYFAKTDTRALQENKVRAQIAEEAEIQLDTEKVREPIDLGNEAIQKAVKSLHDDLTKRGIFQKLGDRMNKPKADFYPKALEALITHTEITTDDLTLLAKARGEAVIKQIVEAGVDAAHLTLEKATEGKDEKAMSATLAIDVSHASSAPDVKHSPSDDVPNTLPTSEQP